MARPNLGFRMEQRQQQQMLLLPKMLQAIEVLQLPHLELSSYLREAFEENEMLALEESPGAPPPSKTRRGTLEDSQRHDEWLANQPAREATLAELIEAQLALVDADGELLEWVRYLVGWLDENGLLSVDDETLLAGARELGLDGERETLGPAIGLLQRLEPRGIGGRDVVEALLLQLDPDDEDYELLGRLVEHHLEDLAKNKLPRVARHLGLELDELMRLLERLKELDPTPARGFATGASQPITPDVLVQPDGDGFEVRVDHGGLPALRIDAQMRKLTHDPEQTAGVKRYLREKLDRARWIVDAVEQRKTTLQRIAARTFHHQRAFLVDGPGHLVPLQMSHVAEELELSVSTVSRGVAGKYVQTPWGIFPLRHFFQSAAGGADTAAREDVREVVRAVIEAEDAARPLSDDEIVEAMRERGIQLARRTVAKYRKELGIPSSYRRRKYA